MLDSDHDRTLLRYYKYGLLGLWSRDPGKPATAPAACAFGTPPCSGCGAPSLTPCSCSCISRRGGSSRATGAGMAGAVVVMTTVGSLAVLRLVITGLSGGRQPCGGRRGDCIKFGGSSVNGNTRKESAYLMAHPRSSCRACRPSIRREFDACLPHELAKRAPRNRRHRSPEALPSVCCRCARIHRQRCRRGRREDCQRILHIRRSGEASRLHTK